jgi:hypothetical protein
MSEIVYVLFNPGMPDLLRIGVMDGWDPSGLMVKLYTENIPFPYDCVYACKVEDGARAEGAVHEKFAVQKIGRHGDFLDVVPESMVEILRPYEVEDVTERFRADFDSTLEDDEKEARARYTTLRRPVRAGPLKAAVANEEKS